MTAGEPECQMNLNDLLKQKVAQDPVNRERIAAAARSLGSFSNRQREQTTVSALVPRPKAEPRRQERLGVVVTITSYRRRLLDEDNLIAGCKSLRDGIAASLGVDDADGRVKFECRQQQTDGAEGTLVMISRVCTRR